jgi:hypothetical protein
VGIPESGSSSGEDDPRIVDELIRRQREGEAEADELDLESDTELDQIEVREIGEPVPQREGIQPGIVERMTALATLLTAEGEGQEDGGHKIGKIGGPTQNLRRNGNPI